MSESWSVAVLAAGQGTRMRSRVPKTVFPLLGRPLIRYAVDRARTLVPHRPPTVVVGHGSEQVRTLLGNEVAYVEQEEQRGTGHAMLQAKPMLQGQSEHLLLYYVDMPLLTAETLRHMMAKHVETEATLTILTVDAPDPRGFGRILRDDTGRVVGIVEESVATPEQLTMGELNVGAYCFRAAWLWQNLDRLPPSPTGEIYITDTISMAVQQGQRVSSHRSTDPEECIGINNRVHLAEAEAILRKRINCRWMLSGVTLVDPATTYIGADAQIGPDTVILPNTHIWGNTTVGSECQLGPNTTVRDSQIGDRVRIECSVIEQAVVEGDVDIGPFAHLRPGAHLAQGVHMGNFGEVKNSHLGPGVKMGHFSYLGDAQVGADVNIGAGTITCNFDGKNKHQTVIEEGALIGSDTMLVAPVRIGRGAKTGAGSVVTRDIPAGSLAYGIPARVQDESAQGKRSRGEPAPDKNGA